jgi:F-type H+-transporting ATPase subunit b
MDLVTPAIGLVFWSVLIFLILLFLLYKFAWKPILGAVNDRNQSIEEALAAADRAKEEMVKLQANNEVVLKEARAERDQILKEARDLKDKMVEEARVAAKQEADLIIKSAKEAIANEKRAAINEMKDEMANLSVLIAEKILEKELGDKEGQKALIESLLKQTNIN